MNARTQVFEMVSFSSCYVINTKHVLLPLLLLFIILQALEGRQVEEAVSCLFHSLLFHRTLGKFHYKQEGNYCVGTVGYQDVDCEFIDLTYVITSLLSDTFESKQILFFNF